MIAPVPGSSRTLEFFNFLCSQSQGQAKSPAILGCIDYNGSFEGANTNSLTIFKSSYQIVPEMNCSDAERAPETSVTY